MTMPSPEWIENFWSNVDKSGSCWEWMGAKMGRGYGSVQFRGKTIGAHRISHFLGTGFLNGKGLVVMHSCDNPSCVNPKHLSVATQSENIRDCVSKGRHVPYVDIKTHCPSGHEYSPDNTIISRKANGNEYKRCKECCREINKRCRDRARDVA